MVTSLPHLHDAVLLAAFEGWNDAGEAASSALKHVADLWRVEPVGKLDPEGYYDFQVNRPRMSVSNGQRTITWPTTSLSVARSATAGIPRDIVIVQGIEPSTNWRGFVTEILDRAHELGVTTVVTVGALLADVPHTRPIPVSISSDDPTLRERYRARVSDYQGPTGIVGVLAEATAQAGIPTLSCWAAVPHYAGAAPSPKATLALLGALETILDASIPQSEISENAQAWERGVDELAEADSDIADYIQSLEAAIDASDLPEASGDAIALEFERYLRRRGDDGPPRQSSG